MQSTAFVEGFPLSLKAYDNPMEIIENTLFMRACQHGILQVELFDTGLPCQRAMSPTRCCPYSQIT